ncbi:MAG: MbnP family protein [Bacteroidota bacterium]|nr:MbnP family protein [Bacteroidota bacterium]
MKIYFFGLILFVVSCKGEKETNGTIVIQFNHYVTAEPLQYKSGLKYFNKSGNKYNIQTCRYIVGKIALVHDNDLVEYIDGYHIIDADNPNTQKITLANIKPGNYKAITFAVGVDTAANNNYLNNGIKPSSLESDISMDWSGMGFRFVVLEGNYIKDSASTSQNSYGYHVGLNENLNLYNFSSSTFNINGNQKTANIKVDFAKFFDGTNQWDISSQETNHSENSRKADTRKLGQNIAQMFSLTSIN